MLRPSRRFTLALALACAAVLSSGDRARGRTTTSHGSTGAGSTAPSKPSSRPAAAPGAAGAIGTAAYDFALENSDGEQVRLSDYRGKVVVLDVWATWCPPCRKEIPGFVALQEKYRDRGVEVIGLSVDDSWDPVHPFMDEYKINYTVVLNEENEVMNYGRIRGIPTTFIIDRDGVIREKHEGYAPQHVFEQAIDELLDA